MQNPTKITATEKSKPYTLILTDANPKLQAFQPKLSIPPYSAKGVPQKPLTESLAAMLGGEK